MILIYIALLDEAKRLTRTAPETVRVELLNRPRAFRSIYPRATGLVVLTLLQCTDIMVKGAIQRAQLAARLLEEVSVTFKTIRGDAGGCVRRQEKCVDTLLRSLGSLCILNESNVVCGNDYDSRYSRSNI